MKKILRYLVLRFFTKYYFVSGTFELRGERKWFRMLYSPKKGFVNENEVRKICENELQYDFDYFLITNFKKISFKEYANF